jgi:glutaredoxin 2
MLEEWQRKAKTQEDCFTQKREVLEQQLRAAERETSRLTQELSASLSSMEALTVAQDAANSEALRLKEQDEPRESRVKTLFERVKDL